MTFKGRLYLYKELGTPILNGMINTTVLDSYVRDRLNRAMANSTR